MNVTAPAFFTGKVRHRRFETRDHSLSMRVFYTYFNIDEPASAFDHLLGWSANRFAPSQFRETDFGPLNHGGLAASIRELVKNAMEVEVTGPIMLLTTLRTWGMAFNPISIYYCYENGDSVEPLAVILEVTNTPWGDRHHYVIDARGSGGVVQAEFDKKMHVSPFFDSELRYRLRTTNDGKRISARLAVSRDDRKVFDADLNLERREMKNQTALSLPFKYLLQTQRVVAAIYLHAVVLFVKRVPFVAKKTAGDHLIKVSSATAVAENPVEIKT